MQLSQLVTSLETSQKLKALGVEQESYFHYRIDEGKWHGTILTSDLLEEYPFYRKISISTFTSAELGEILPAGYVKFYKIMQTNFDPPKAQWRAEYHERPYIECETEAEARGKLLIYLKENNLLGKE